ncbi:MAG TPA: hypothetical protein VL443_06865 [Cyclobacteriaceae bacterium]|nr:hypothetical protein [Cyclobacteriaceae bacterium]
MKAKLVLITLAWVATYSSASACAICGCGVGNYYFGIMPQFHKNFVGLRYRNYSYTSHIGAGYKPFEATHETFSSAELWARFYPTKRIQLVTILSYSFNTQVDQGVTKDIQGVGDIPIFVNYNILNTNNQPLSEARVLNHNLLVGGGIKLPTGKYKYTEDPTQVANANFQLGTGSVDFMTNLLYTLRFKRFGLSVDATYKMNTANSNKYQFGNRASGTASVFYVQQIKKFGVMPNAGIYAEDSGKNKQYDIKIDNTGGAATFASAGVETYYKNLSIGFNYQSPMVQHLASNHSKAHDKVMVHVTFMF